MEKKKSKDGEALGVSRYEHTNIYAFDLQEHNNLQHRFSKRAERFLKVLFRVLAGVEAQRDAIIMLLSFLLVSLLSAHALVSLGDFANYSKHAVQISRHCYIVSALLKQLEKLPLVCPPDPAFCFAIVSF